MGIINSKKEYYNEILELNKELVHFLSPMDMEKLIDMDRETAIHQVMIENDEVVGFLMVFNQDANYDSVNFLWFKENYEKFLYIDRIVIKPKQHGKGIGKKFYEKAFEYAKETGYNIITCEIDIKPANPKSLAFHKAMGFEEVGTQVIKDGAKEVSLQAKNLNK